MELLNQIISNINDVLWGYILIALLIILGIYFSIKTRFVQFRYFKEMIRLLGDGLTSSSKKDKKKGSISSFQAFCISTASRVGTGNIAGIAIAISVGGPGAVFWMWLIALIGAASSFVESTLAQVYKQKNPDGTFRGGPAYYMKKGLNKKWMGVAFSVLISICFGLIFNSVQANTITIAFNNAFGTDRLLVGIVITIITCFVIFGGVTRVAKVSEIIVPVMALAYIGVAVFIVITNITELPSVLKLIFENAFGFREVVGGTLGGAVLMGIKRGLFSNEAGMGSAPNAAATADVSHPVKQGLIQTLGVFTDTLLICSCTAFMILLSDVNYMDKSVTGISLAQNALTSELGSWAGIFLAICILLFAFSSIVGNYYYGESNIEFLNSKKYFLVIYRVLVIGMVLFGSVAEIQIVWNLADLFMGLMAILNLIAISLLSKKAFLVLKDYTKQKKAGIKEPVFKASSIPGLENVSEWK